MAISEELCWAVLRMVKDRVVSRSWLKGSETNEPDLQHAIPLHELEYELVLRHTKSQIEDSIYFLQKRGYLAQHGFPGLIRVAYQLTQRALGALDAMQFSDEEQTAFQEALLDMKKPGWLGMKINLGEAWRRMAKRATRK